MDKLTAEPGTVQFLGQLLGIARSSDHPMDKALVKALKRGIRAMGGQFCLYCDAVIEGHPCPHCGGRRQESHPVYAMMRATLDEERKHG